MNSRVIIRICRHTFPDGHHCQGAAVHGRAYCRHHLDARTRLHNLARARRCVRLPRLLVAETSRDLAYNQAEVCRVLATERIHPDAARMMLWAMDLTAAALPAEPASRPHRAHNPNVVYHVPINPLFAQLCAENPSQLVENTKGIGEGGTPHSRLGNPTAKRVRFLQPRWDDRAKPSASEAATKLVSDSGRSNKSREITVPEARHNLTHHAAKGGVVG